MADNFKKIDKEYLLTDSSVNSYGYRLLTSGYLLDEFKKNPIGYYMHGKHAEYPREMGVLVRWDELRQDGDKIYGKPCINLDHPRGERTVNEIENGFLNAASLGHFVVMEVSENPNDYLDGQTGVTVSKWYNRECSLVDIPGNYNALSDLFDEDNNPLTLEDLNAKNVTMKQLFLTPEQLGLLNLRADAEPSAVTTALNNLAAEAVKVPKLTEQLATAQTALKELQATVAAKEINDLTTSALADGKITKEVGEKLKLQYADKPEALKDLLAAMPVLSSVTAAIAAGNDEAKDLAAKSWSELDKAGKLPELLAKDPETFKAKYKAQFGKEYK